MFKNKSGANNPMFGKRKTDETLKIICLYWNYQRVY